MRPEVEVALTINGIYSEAELTRLLEYAESLPAGATVVEIGVLYGRSSSIFFQTARSKSLKLYFIDPWVVNEWDTFMSFHETYKKRFFRVPFVMVNTTSIESEALISPSPSLVHIDGYHEPQGVWADCRIWCPRLVSGGIVVFHDYTLLNPNGDLQYPGIQRAAEQWCKGWEPLGIVDTQAAFRKP